jgi:hypothetical protein
LAFLADIVPDRIEKVAEMGELTETEIRGQQFDILVNFVFRPGTDLNSWQTAIEFVESTFRLYQPEPGPCGLFAVLQAYILLNHKRNPDHSNQDCLIESVLDIMFKLRQSSVYILCHVFDRENKVLIFVSSDKREAVKKFLDESGILATPIAALLLALSFVCLAGPSKLSSLSLNEPMLEADGKTTVQFVLLMITGNMADSASADIRVVASTLYLGVLVRQEIGYLIQDEEEAHDIVGDALGKPKELIWVRFLGGHFDVIVYTEDEFRLFDPFDQTPVEWILIKPMNPIYDRLLAALPPVTQETRVIEPSMGGEDKRPG